MYLVCRLPLRSVSRVLHTSALHDALPISAKGAVRELVPHLEQHAGLQVVRRQSQHLAPHVLSVDRMDIQPVQERGGRFNAFFLMIQRPDPDRKSTRLNSSHRCISYAVFRFARSPASCTLLPYTTLFRSRRKAPSVSSCLTLNSMPGFRWCAVSPSTWRRTSFPSIEWIFSRSRNAAAGSTPSSS